MATGRDHKTRASLPAPRLFDADFLTQFERLRACSRPGRGRSGLAGRHRSAAAGASLDFADHRSYNPGDDLRYLDWNYFARTGRPVVRLFHRHAARRIGILLDTSASMGLGEKFTFARRLAAGIAMLALSVFDQVRLVGFAERIGPQLHAWQHPQKFAAVLEFLEGLGPRGQTDLLACARQYPPVDGAEMLLVISDLLCAQHLEQAIGLLRRRHQQVRVLHIIDACDADPDLAGQLRLEEVESGGAMAVEASPQLLQAYRCQWDGFCQAAHAACVGKGAEFDAIYTHDNWAQAALSAIE